MKTKGKIILAVVLSVVFVGSIGLGIVLWQINSPKLWQIGVGSMAVPIIFNQAIIVKDNEKLNETFDDAFKQMPIIPLRLVKATARILTKSFHMQTQILTKKC